MLNPLVFLKERGLVEATTPDCDSYLMGKSPKVYLGVDPTAGSLHLGNLQGFIVAKWLERMGCDVTLLIGDMTASVGDPSGKSTERQVLDHDRILENSRTVQNWIRSFMGPSVRFVNNLEWFGHMRLTNYLGEIGRFFRMGPMLSKEWIRRRIQSDVGMSYTEFSYQLLQAYDFLHLFRTHGIRLQMGGSDQWGNMTAGCDLIRRREGEASHAFVWPLLTKEDGSKFGKTESGAIWLDASQLSPASFYQQIIGFSDLMVSRCFRRLTFLSLEEIESLEQTLSKRERQHRLAEELTVLLHGQKGLQEALAVKKVQKPLSEISLKDLEVANAIVIDRVALCHRKLIDLCTEWKWVKSKSECRRLIQQGAVLVNGKKIEDEGWIFQETDLHEGRFFFIVLGKKKRFILDVSKN
ncbi:tyrosine--tRNA ligase [Candidatus Similichlamydia laticola]|uniref:Tyrosine--tRNA ligase n=1 Tax=Candidatus Similichlamydia laticola TaxID=2170265 RepID=A0A369KJ03_9BACT|nr:tyrosine--tRNA ligase [Candidatus Similichlamydia laticola]RDB31763.1 Tyrosyl-tRNA synthetase [Candidatus Similichlamydia laticola]